MLPRTFGSVAPLLISFLILSTPFTTSAALTSWLGYGSRGVQVTELQNFLKSTGDFTAAATGYFGSVTETALKKYQAREGIVSSGTPATTGYGVVGPCTRAFINAAMTGSAKPSCGQRAPQSTPTPATPTTSTNTPPSASLTASATEVRRGESVTLSWTSQNTASCRLTGTGVKNASTNTSGTYTTTSLTRYSTFNLLCKGTKSGRYASDRVSVRVSTSPTTPATPATPTTSSPSNAPAITFSSNTTSVSAPGTVVLSWNAPGASTCGAGGGWSGTKAASGTQTITGLLRTTAFALACRNGSGVSTAQPIVVTVSPLAIATLPLPGSSGSSGPAPSFTGTEEEEFVGPFASWKNVKTDYGAVGNGSVDDTAAFQRALDDLDSGTLYIPAGTYKITSTLRITNRGGVSAIGEHPATTKLKWAGGNGGTILKIVGVMYSKFNRITFDGSGTAEVLVDQTWETGYFDTGNEYADDVFMDAGYGIRCGQAGGGCAETAVMRSKFLRNSTAGIAMRNFNALDMWVWDSLFEDNEVGITNSPEAGDWSVYNSVFKDSKKTDLEFGNTSNFSARHNYSEGSRMFVSGGGWGNPAPTVLQGNVIVDPGSSTVISMNNQGPLVLLDNIIKSGSGGPTVSHTQFTSTETVLVGNTFSSPNMVSVNANGRLISIDNTTGSPSTKEPELPATPVNKNRRVFEVSGTDAASIQAAINSAVSSGAVRPVVHLPEASYRISSTITIPAGSDVQIVGDGHFTDHDNGSILHWNGSGQGPVLRVMGPSKATIRNIGIDGNGAEAIRAEGVDQIGSRVFMHQVALRGSRNHGLLVDRLDHTLVDSRNGDFAYQKSGIDTKVIGGPLTASGSATNGRTVIFSGAASNDVPEFTVEKGGRLLVRDYWTEQGGPAVGTFTDSGTFTADNLLIAHPQNQTPAFTVNSFKGRITFLATQLWDRIVIGGDGSQSKVMVLGLVGGNISGVVPNSLINNTNADARLLNSRQMGNYGDTATVPLSNIGSADASFVKDMLAQTRNEKAQPLTKLSSGVTDLRLFTLYIIDASVGVHLLP